jgi:hypothetical protein
MINYLKDNKTSLEEKCLFHKRFTFSKNFKKFVGISVSDFASKQASTKDNKHLIVD